MAYSLITAQGYPWEDGASGYYLRDAGMELDNMSNTTQLFLGTQMVCAQCTTIRSTNGPNRNDAFLWD